MIIVIINFIIVQGITFNNKLKYYHEILLKY